MSGGTDISATATSIESLKLNALSLRRHVLRMAERVGQGYVGQGLGIADLLAVLYFREMKYDPHNLAWPDRDPLSSFYWTLLNWVVCRPGRGRHNHRR